MHNRLKKTVTASTSAINLPASIEEVLADVSFREVLREVLSEHVAEELLMFYEAIENFESLPTRELRDQEGLKMIDDFIAAGSEYSVNLSNFTRNELLAVAHFAPDTFNQSKRDAINLMGLNYFNMVKEQLIGEEVSGRISSVSSNNDSENELVRQTHPIVERKFKWRRLKKKNYSTVSSNNAEGGVTKLTFSRMLSSKAAGVVRRLSRYHSENECAVSL